MWSTDTPWFDVALPTSIFAVGSILKLAVVLGAALVGAQTWGRPAEYAMLLIPLVGAAYVHPWWLPKHGVNGWTGEPRDKYLALVTRPRR